MCGNDRPFPGREPSPRTGEERVRKLALRASRPSPMDRPLLPFAVEDEPSGAVAFFSGAPRARVACTGCASLFCVLGVTRRVLRSAACRFAALTDCPCSRLRLLVLSARASLRARRQSWPVPARWACHARRRSRARRLRAARPVPAAHPAAPGVAGRFDFAGVLSTTFEPATPTPPATPAAATTAAAQAPDRRRGCRRPCLRQSRLFGTAPADRAGAGARADRHHGSGRRPSKPLNIVSESGIGTRRGRQRRAMALLRRANCAQSGHSAR